MKLVKLYNNNPINWFQRGEERGFNFVFKELYAALCLYCSRITKDQSVAEEIVSTVFIKTWEIHERFNELSAIKAYLYKAVYNNSLKYLREQHRKCNRYNVMVYLLRNAIEHDHFKYIVEAELLREIYGVMNELPPSCKKVFTMLYIEGKSIKEIAKELQLSVSTIKTQKQRGLAYLRKCL